MIHKIEQLFKKLGKSLMEHRSLGTFSGVMIGTQMKSDVDNYANDIIEKKLKKLTPDIPIISEENKRSHKTDRFKKYWLLDPLDGTASYCKGFSGFVIQIALMQSHKPVLSVVYSPYFDQIYTAELNSGAFLNSKKISINYENKKIVIIDNYPKPIGYTNYLFNNIPCHEYEEMGSFGLKICRVADSCANLFVKNVLFKDWDIAPGHLIIEEAGGIVSDFNGNKIQYLGDLEKKDGLIVTNSIHTLQKVIEIKNNT